MGFTIISAMESVNGQMHVNVAWRTGFCGHGSNPKRKSVELLQRMMDLLIGHALQARQICAKQTLDQGIVMVSRTCQLISTMIWLALVISNVTNLEVNSNATVPLASCGIRCGSMTHNLWIINYRSKSLTRKNRKRVLAVGQVKTKVRAAKTMVLLKDHAQQTNYSK